MEIITGYTGQPHVTSEQDRDINIGIVGRESYVLTTGQMMKAEVTTNNEIKIRDGVIMHQGCAASIKKNTYDSLTIMNGSQGMKRIDLLVARYEKNVENGNTESLRIVVLQGEPAENNPEVPEHVEGDIQAGDAIADMPMYQVMIDGLNIVEVKKVFKEAGDIVGLNEKVDELNSNRTYSENEVRIGTTADGEPVYRKIIKVPMTYFTKKEQYVDLKAGTGTSMKKIISCSVQAHSADGTIYPFPYTEGGTEMSTWLHKFTTVNGGTIMHFYNKAEWGSSYTAYITVEYTKL